MAPVMGSVRLLAALALALPALTTGADHEVQQVKGPHVVSHELGPLMEVSGGSEPSTPREQREASFPSSGCYSCTVGGLGSSGNKGYSSRQEMRREQQYVDGEPVYDLFQERRFENGRIVHDRKIERDEDDFGHRPRSRDRYPSQSSLTRSSGSHRPNHGRPGHYNQPAYGNTRSHSQNYGSSEGYEYSGSHGQDEFSGNYDSEVARMRENMRRRMMSLGSQQPTSGSSHRSEYSSQTRYVNGKAVYEKKEERKFRDGKLVHEDVQEKGPDDLGTGHASGNRDSSAHWRQWERREQSLGHNTHPGYGLGHPTHSREQQSSGVHSVHPSVTRSSSTRHSQTSSYSPQRKPIYPYRPTYGSQSSEHRSEESSLSYPSHRPGSRRPSVPDTGYYTPYDSTRTSSEESRTSTYQPANPSPHPSSRTSPQHRDDSGYPYQRPSSERPFVPSQGQTRQYSSSSSSSSSETRFTQQHQTPAADDLELTEVQQGARAPEDDVPSNRYGQHSSDSLYNWESSEDQGPSYGPYTNQRQTSTSRSRVSETTRESHYRGYDGSSNHQPVDSSNGGARTVIFDLSSPSSSRPGSRRPNSDEVSQTSEEESGPDDLDDVDDSQSRYDISPLEDDFQPGIMHVDNEMEPSDWLRPTADNEIDSSDITRPRGGATVRQDTAVDDSYFTHSSRVTPAPDTRRRPPVSPSSGYDYSYSRREMSDHTDSAPRAPRPSPQGEPTHTRPAFGGSRHYLYNETRRRTTVVGDQEQLHPGALPDTSCSQENGCVVVGAPQSMSRRFETRLTYRYVNGHLVGATQHERQYENDVLVHENTKQLGRDEVARLNLGEYGGDQLDMPEDSFSPGSYSQQHEVREERQYVDGRQVYDLHHERHFEDGNLVYNKLTEKDEDDLREANEDLDVAQQSGEEAGYWLTQTNQQHTPRSETTVGSMDWASQTHQTVDSPHVPAAPTYTSRRYESRRVQETVDGEPLYDLQHERLYRNGSLVYENKTEHNLETQRGGGHRDALHDILAGNTLVTATQRPYYRQVPGPAEPHTQPSQSGEPYENSGTSQRSEFNSQSRQSYGSYGQTAGNNEGPYSQGMENYDQSRTSQNTGSYRGSTGSDGTAEVSETRSQSFSNQETLGTSLLTPYNPGSGRATTTVLGGSDSLLTGSGALRSGSSGHDSTSGSESTESISSSSSHHHVESSSSGGSGCLTCVLLAGSGRQGSSLGNTGDVGGGGGYSQRHEMSTEEHYEDGQLVHGVENSRSFQNGQIVHESTRQYPDDSDAQVSQTAGLKSFSTGLGSVPSSHSSWSSWSSWSSSSVPMQPADGDVCASDPCRNGGTCLPGVYGPICTCRFGFSGAKCEEVQCLQGYCRYGGTCSVENGAHVCQCRSGFTGPRCERRTRRRIAHS